MRTLTIVAAIAAAAAIAPLSSPLALAQTTASTAPAAAATKPVNAAARSLAAPGAKTTGHSEAAIDCSKQADSKGLHGKARVSFRASCKAAAKKS